MAFRNVFGDRKKAKLVFASLFMGAIIFLFVSTFIKVLDDEYFSNIMLDISKLLDSLLLLECKEVFPMDEDTLVLKLQDRIIKIGKWTYFYSKQTDKH